MKDYDAVLSEYIKEDILEDVINETYVTNCHYLPRLPFVGEDRSKTRIRTAFELLRNITTKNILMMFWIKARVCYLIYSTCF